MFNHFFKWLISLSLLILMVGCSNQNFQLPFGSFGTTDTNDTANNSYNAMAESKQIALLLPLSGSMGGPGRAVREGFMASYYQAAQSGQTSAQVKVYDTASGNVEALYKKAISDGADCVIGPLEKEKVQEIMRSPIPVTTIVLNYPVTHAVSSNNLYQFGLSPLDEARQVAQYAHEQGRNSAIIISPAGLWGNGVANAFRAEWKKLGGSVAIQYSYTSNQDMGPYIRQALQVNDNKAHVKRLEQLLGRQLRIEEHRRQDVDMIFLVALPPKARQINPLLKFYYAGDIPVYSISVIYSGVPTPMYDQDLDGITFEDMPWIFNLDAITLSHYPRLYALGMDAFTLVMQRHQWQNSPTSGIAGKTGTLYLEPGNKITRRDLTWARFQAGEAQPI